MMNSLSNLLFQSGLHPSQLDVPTMAHSIIGQMRIGLYAGKSSLPMLPTQLTAMGEIEEDCRVAVAHISEKNIETTCVHISKTECKEQRGESFPLPGVEYPSTFEDLIFAIAELLEPILSDCDRIAVCLPFPMESDCILRVKASLRISDFEGKSLTKALSEELESRGITGKAIVAIPSVCASICSAIANVPQAKRFFTLSWGHGTNTGFSLPKTVILKLHTGETTLNVVDCCSGDCESLPIGTVDLAMDRDSSNPGENLLDKMVSIESIGEVYRLTMIKAIEAKLLTFMCGRHFLSLKTLRLEDFISFLESPDGDNALAHFCSEAEEDRQVALAVANAVLSRCVSLLCANIAAMLLLTGAGASEDEPAVISLCGDAFTEPFLLDYFKQHASSLLKESLHLHCIWHDATKSMAIGASRCAILNA